MQCHGSLAHNHADTRVAGCMWVPNNRASALSCACRIHILFVRLLKQWLKHNPHLADPTTPSLCSLLCEQKHYLSMYIDLSCPPLSQMPPHEWLSSSTTASCSRMAPSRRRCCTWLAATPKCAAATRWVAQSGLSLMNPRDAVSLVAPWRCRAVASPHDTCVLLLKLAWTTSCNLLLTSTR